MFGRVAHMLDRNAIICLSVTAAILLVAGLCLAVTAPAAKAQVPQRTTPAKAAEVHAIPAKAAGAHTTAVFVARPATPAAPPQVQSALCHKCTTLVVTVPKPRSPRSNSTRH